MKPALKKLLRQSISVATLSSRNAAGDPTYGTPATVSAWVERENKVIHSSVGEERVTTHIIITEDAITETDRIWLPGDSSADATLARRPAIVDAILDELTQVTHYETRV